MIRIPLLHRKSAVPLKRCIELAANRSGRSEEQVVEVMTLFLEAIADEVTKGRAVSIPGFGMFVQSGVQRFQKVTFRPNFIPSKPFRDQVTFGTRPDPTVRRAANFYSRNHARGGGDKGGRAFAVLERIRKAVTAQVNAK